MALLLAMAMTIRTWKLKTARKEVPAWSLPNNGLACADILYHRTNFFLLCTPTVLIYNCELGIIISSDFFGARKLWKKDYVLPSIFMLFLVRCGRKLPHEVFRTFLYSPK